MAKSTVQIVNPQDPIDPAGPWLLLKTWVVLTLGRVKWVEALVPKSSKGVVPLLNDKTVSVAEINICEWAKKLNFLLNSITDIFRINTADTICWVSIVSANLLNATGETWIHFQYFFSFLFELENMKIRQYNRAVSANLVLIVSTLFLFYSFWIKNLMHNTQCTRCDFWCMQNKNWKLKTFKTCISCKWEIALIE